MAIMKHVKKIITPGKIQDAILHHKEIILTIWGLGTKYFYLNFSDIEKAQVFIEGKLPISKQLRKEISMFHKIAIGYGMPVTIRPDNNDFIFNVGPFGEFKTSCIDEKFFAEIVRILKYRFKLSNYIF